MAALRSVTGGALAMAGLVLTAGPLVAGEPSDFRKAHPLGERAGSAATIPGSQPFYAHNDYRNPRPLVDALAAGFRGVEADLYLVDGQLLVAHDRTEAEPPRTLESLYLRPLQERIRRDGQVISGGRPFLLNVELKAGEPAAYDSLYSLLLRYRELLTIVEDGRERPGPVQVVLVGWHPPLADLQREALRLAAVQWLVTSGRETPPELPAHLIRLISVNYGRSALWSRGRGPGSAIDRQLRRLRQAGTAVPGRITRVYNVPLRESVYRRLFECGVDLIGTKSPDASRRLMESTSRSGGRGSGS